MPCSSCNVGEDGGNNVKGTFRDDSKDEQHQLHVGQLERHDSGHNRPIMTLHQVLVTAWS
jgi:hypothetical protein